MIFDALLQVSGGMTAAGAMFGQAVAGTNTSVLSTNTIDMGPPMMNGVPGQLGDIGSGETLEVSFTVLTAPTGGTSVQFQLIQADDAALSVNVEVLVQTGAIPIASLPAGSPVVLPAAHAAAYAPRRYIGTRYVLVGAIASMTVFAGLVKNVQNKPLFKGGYGIA